MQLVIRIDTENAAFDDDDLSPALAQMLQSITAEYFTNASRVQVLSDLFNHQNIKDENGNVVGTVVIDGQR